MVGSILRQTLNIEEGMNGGILREDRIALFV